MQTDGTSGIPEQPALPGVPAAVPPASAATDQLTDREVIELFVSGKSPSVVRAALRAIRRMLSPKRR